MINLSPSVRRILPAGLGFFAWIGSFLLFWKLSGSLPPLPHDVALFFSAVFLVLLSCSLIGGLLCLCLPRSFWLACGAISIALIALVAKPAVQRTQEINRLASIPGTVLFMTANTSLPPVHEADPVIRFRNKLFREQERFLEGFFPIHPKHILALALAQLLLAAGLGLWIGLGIDKAGHLIPLALVASLADIWSVSGGATAVIIKSAHIRYFLLRFPLAGGCKIK